MKKFVIAASAVATLAPMAMPAPALALDRRDVRQEQRECSRELRRADNRREYRQELKECRREVNREVRENRRDRRQAVRDWRHYRNYDWNRFEPGSNRYYADRYYRSGSYYADRRLSRYDRVYRGYDGRYYCRRDDGTTGLIIGAGLGALLGNQVDIGGSRALNTILGGAAGAAIGHAIDKGDARCD
ncbi:MAG TPA: glycine zipper 2TM domain-containing protein [Sphingomicrobium sp.]|nr:glycine zipper 2TM domain-containing protein [Sphingomicrobium sp.]